MKTLLGLLLTVGLCIPLTAQVGLYASVGVTTDRTDVLSTVATYAPLDSGYLVFFSPERSNASVGGITFEVGAREQSFWNLELDSSLEFSLTFGESGSNEFSPFVDGSNQGSWSVGDVASLKLNSKIGYAPLQWNWSGKRVSPYLGIGAGRLRGELSKSERNRATNKRAYGYVRSFGLGVKIRSSKRSIDVGVFREFYWVQRGLIIPWAAESNWLVESASVDQWKMKAAFTMYL